MIDLSRFDTKNHFSSADFFVTKNTLQIDRQSLAHVAKILQSFSKFPYENLSKILRLNEHWDDSPHRLPGNILDDYDRFRFGGTCFSLTYFLKTILDYYGYETDIVMMNMKAGKNLHCALILKFDSREFLLDPGYLLNQPLEIGVADSTLPFDPVTNTYSLWTLDGHRPKWRYSFQKKPTQIADFISFWSDSFHWKSMSGICLSKRDENGFLYIHNHYFQKIGGGKQYKGNFKEEISVLAEKFFGVSPKIVRRAEIAVAENLFREKELNMKVAHRIQ